MKKISKKLLSLMLAVIMAMPVILSVPMGAEAATHQISTNWSLINSTDFTKTDWKYSSASGSYNNTDVADGQSFIGVGSDSSNYVSWSGVEYWKDEKTEYPDGWNRFYKDSDIGVKVRDGFMFLNDWFKNGTSQTLTPITGLDSFKIDVNFSFFGTYALAGTGSDDYWKNTFIKLKTDDYSTQSNIWQNQWFSQAGYGSMYKTGDSAKDSATVLRKVGDDGATNDYFEISTDNLGTGTQYHYVLTFSHNIIRAYITTDNNGEEGDIVINLGSFEWAGDTNNIKGIMLGATSGSNSNVYYQNIAYKNIRFYEGSEASYSPEKDNANDHYLYAYFTGNSDSGERLRYAVSDDGYNWESLNGANAVANVQSIASTLSVYPSGGATGLGATGNVRDPYILYAQDGTYYVLATDLDTDTYGFNNNCKLLVWHVSSLADIDTATPWVIDTTSLMSDYMGSGCTIDRAWAPEAVYDYEAGKYMIVFASSDSSDTYGTRMFYVYTSDFKNFDGKAKLLLPHVSGNNIDGNLTYADGLYYLWYKDETNSKIGVATSEHASGPYGVVKSFYDDRIASVYEGPEVYYNTQAGKYILIADNFGGGSYMGAYQNDSVGGFSASDKLTDGTEYNMTHMSPRHGFITRISTSDYNALIAKYGRDVWANSNIDSGDTADDYLIARYFTTFDATLDASGHNNHLDSANVVMGDYNGKYAADFADSKVASKAIATMFDNEGINAKDGMTFDWYGYSTNDDKGRYFDLASVEMGTCVWDGSGNNQKNANYIYASEGIEYGAFYGNGSGRTGVSHFYADTENEWHRYTMTISNGWYEFYVDGTLLGYSVSFSNSDRANITANCPAYCSTGVSDTVLDSMINLSFGDSAWRDDADFTGAISDFRIYNRALTYADVASADSIIGDNSYKISSLTNDSILYYDPMEDKDASDSYDSVAKHAYSASTDDATYGKVLNIAGGVTSQNGSVENAAYVDATSTDKAKGYTISFLYNPGTIEGGNQAIFNLGVDDTPWGTRKIFELCENGYLRFIWDVNGAGDDFIDYYGLFGSGLTANEWNKVVLHFVPTAEYDDVYCYINGVLVNSFSFEASAGAKLSRKCMTDYLKEAARNVYYGNSCGYSSDSASGMLDEFKIYEGLIDVQDIIDQDFNNAISGMRTSIEGNLSTLVSTYESRMNGTVYKNMEAAYNAYVKANEVLDANEYGNLDDETAYSALNTAYNNLNTALGNMTAWSAYTGTAEGKIVNATATGAYSNILYCSTSTSFSNGNNWTGCGYLNMKSMVPSKVVMYYDGNKSNSYFPVAFEAYNTGNNGSNRRVSYVYLTTTIYGANGQPNTSTAPYDNELEFVQDWGGYQQGWSDPLNWSSVYQPGNYPFGYYIGDTDNYQDLEKKSGGGPHRFWGNRAVVKSSATDHFSKTNMKFEMYNGDRNACVGMENECSIYLVDYNQVKTAINSSKKDYLDQVASYKENGLESLFEGYDDATAYDITSYFSNASDSNIGDCYNSAENAAESVSAGINALGTPTADGSNYTNLKSKMTAVKSNYELGEAALKAIYTSDSVDAFIDAYEDAVDHFSALTTNSYASATAGTLLSALNGAVLDTLADLTQFDAAFTKADKLLKSLDGKAAQYDKTSIDALITAMTTGSTQTYGTSNAAARANYGQAVQTAANGYKTAILNALNGLTVAAPAETESAYETYEAAVEKINNLDPDAYDSTKDSIDTGILGANTSIADEETSSYLGTTTIYCVDTTKDAEAIDDATQAILTGLSLSVKEYTITATGTTEITANVGSYKGGKATYGTKMTFRSGDPETAWYLEIQTGSMHKMEAFQTYGEKLVLKVVGTTTVKAVKKGEGQSQVKIIRKYNNDEREPIQYVNYVDNSTRFNFPNATALPYYEFQGYYDENDQLIDSSYITVTEDVVIYAKYNASSASCAINSTDIENTAKSMTVDYNNRVDLTGGAGAYGWVEKVGSTYRPFYIGENVSFLASESVELKAVNKAAFDSYGSTPCINLRQSGVIINETKTIFNAQLVFDSAAYTESATNKRGIKEYGILVAAPSSKNGYTAITPSDSQVVIENSGQQQGFAVYRAKSTKLVGANQFAISISNLPEGYKYRGYLIYSDSDGNLQTVYSDIMR